MVGSSRHAKLRGVVSRGKRGTRPRTLRREAQRAGERRKLEADRLWRLQAGGSPELPMEVATASLVEPRARSLTCPHCGVGLRLEEHVVTHFAGKLLREARLSCPRCGGHRSAWFRIVHAAPN